MKGIVLLTTCLSLASCGWENTSRPQRPEPILPVRNSEEPQNSWRSLPSCLFAANRIFACEVPWTKGQPCPNQVSAASLDAKMRALRVALEKLDLHARRALCLVAEIWLGPLPDGAWGAVDKVAFTPEGWGQYHLYLDSRIFDHQSLSSWLLYLDQERWQAKVPLSYEYLVEGGDPLMHLLHHELGHILDDHLNLTQGQICHQSDCLLVEDSFAGQHWLTFSQPKEAAAQELQRAFCLDPQLPCPVPLAAADAPFTLIQRLAQTRFPSAYSLFNAREFAAEAFAWHALQGQNDHSFYRVIEHGEATQVGFDLGISSWID